MALKNIVESVQNCSDVYALAVSAYALQLANHESKKLAIDRLRELAKVNGNKSIYYSNFEETNLIYLYPFNRKS